MLLSELQSSTIALEPAKVWGIGVGIDVKLHGTTACLTNQGGCVRLVPEWSGTKVAHPWWDVGS